MDRRCVACGNDLPDYVRADKHYCSVRCRMAAMRAKARGVAVTEQVDKGYTAVTDNPPPAVPASSSQSLSKADLDARFPIPDDLTIPKWLRREPDAPHWKDYDKDSSLP